MSRMCTIICNVYKVFDNSVLHTFLSVKGALPPLISENDAKTFQYIILGFKFI